MSNTPEPAESSAGKTIYENVTPAETDRNAKPYYLVVAVSDIRGFTSLTSRVNHFCQSRLNLSSEMSLLSKEYVEYMQETQVLARLAMTSHLSEEDTKVAVVKSTGDGYMVAVRLAAIEDGALSENDERSRAQTITFALLEGLRDLVENATPKGKQDHPENTFAGKTLRFIQKWGSYLGIAELDYRLKRADLYIAGGIALGTGFFSDTTKMVNIFDDNGKPVVDDKGQPVLKLIRESDAFGHAANLAFRLCDKAGREGRDGRNNVPDILLDRRVGKFVEASAKSSTHAYKLRAFRTPLELKGIEENWCMSYGLED